MAPRAGSFFNPVSSNSSEPFAPQSKLQEQARNPQAETVPRAQIVRRKSSEKVAVNDPASPFFVFEGLQLSDKRDRVDSSTPELPSHIPLAISDDEGATEHAQRAYP